MKNRVIISITLILTSAQLVSSIAEEVDLKLEETITSAKEAALEVAAEALAVDMSRFALTMREDELGVHTYRLNKRVLRQSPQTPGVYVLVCDDQRIGFVSVEREDSPLMVFAKGLHYNLALSTEPNGEQRLDVTDGDGHLEVYFIDSESVRVANAEEYRTFRAQYAAYQAGFNEVFKSVTDQLDEEKPTQD